MYIQSVSQRRALRALHTLRSDTAHKGYKRNLKGNFEMLLKGKCKLAAVILASVVRYERLCNSVTLYNNCTLFNSSKALINV